LNAANTLQTTAHVVPLLLIVILVLVTLLLLARMVLRVPDAGMRFSGFGLSLDIFRGRRRKEPEPSDEEPPRQEG
jgi:hypothetical protein